MGHLIAFEIFVAPAIAKAIRGPAEPVKKARSATKEPIVSGLADSRRARDLMFGKAIFPIGK